MIFDKNHPLYSSSFADTIPAAMHRNFGRRASRTLRLIYGTPPIRCFYSLRVTNCFYDFFYNLPPDVLHCNTPNTFKKHLKTNLFTSSLTSPDWPVMHQAPLKLCIMALYKCYINVCIVNWYCYCYCYCYYYCYCYCYYISYHIKVITL